MPGIVLLVLMQLDRIRAASPLKRKKKHKNTV